MIRHAIHSTFALSVVAGALSFATPSRADDVTVVTPAPVVVTRTEPTSDTVRTQSSPDTRTMGSGIVTFGISYGIAIGVAAGSRHEGDDHMYVPLVGPWLDLGDRGNCPQSGSCAKETANRAFIAVDGVFQALGVLSFVTGLVFQRSNDVTTTTTGKTLPIVEITPVRYAHGGLGLAAVGTF
jgi:hypothetical protein